MKVLFVDDSDFYLHFRRGFFTRMGYFILNARSAEQAAETIELEKPDLVVVASRLKDGSGVDFCRRIRKPGRKQGPRVILIAESDASVAGAAAWDDFLLRPVDPEDLMARISATLQVPQRRSQRLGVKLQVNYGSKRDRLTGTTRDLSPDGMLIEASEPLKIGTRLELEFALPGHKRTLNAKGEVVRATRLGSDRRHGIGVRFIDLDAATRETILAFLG